MTPDVDAHELRAVFGSADAVTLEPIDPQLRLHSVTGGVFRAVAGNRSAVLKVVRHGVDDDPGGLWLAGAEATHRNYWKREWRAFDSGLLDALPGRLRAPRSLLTTQPADDVCHIWMEDVDGIGGVRWDVDDYPTPGRDLGSTQGAFASGTVALPDDEWLSRRWLRGWVDATGRHVPLIADDAYWRDERLAPLALLRRRTLALWEERSRLFDIVESAPQTLVHLDFWPANLIAADDGTTVAIDWSQIGLGAVAQDLDQIILDPLWMQVLRDADARQLERRVLPAYVEGLHASGLDVSEHDVQRWYAAAASAHYAPMLGFQAANAADPHRVTQLEQRWSTSYASIVEVRARAVRRAVELGEWVLS